MPLANLGKNFQDRVHRAPQEWQSTRTSPSGGGYSSPEEEEEVNTFINDFHTRKVQRIKQTTSISSMGELVLRRKYSIGEIREVVTETGVCRWGIPATAINVTITSPISTYFL